MEQAREGSPIAKVVVCRHSGFEGQSPGSCFKMDWVPKRKEERGEFGRLRVGSTDRMQR